MPSNKKGEAVLQDVFRYNDWANGKLLALCEGLSESQWDAPHTMGFGSLRATLFHVLVADELWQDRLENKPWAPLPTDERQIALAELHARYAAVAERRRRILQQEHSTGYERLVEYMNTERQSFRHRLCELLLHLANHSIHHRAQALNMLRRQQRTVPGGLDYLFYKLAHPSLPQPPEMAALVRSWKFDVGEATGETPQFHAERLRQYCDYGNWATDLLLTAAGDVEPGAWTRDFEIGPGSLQKTLSHVFDAERWWLGNLTQSAGDFATTEETISPTELRSRWRQHVSDRTAWLSGQSDASLGDAVTGTVSGGLLQFRRGEVLLQLCGHGTHHRAQVVNIFRRLDERIPALDFVAWLRLGSPLPHPL